MKKPYLISRNVIGICALAMALLVFNSCDRNIENNADKELFSGFQTPPAEARPFVRWWWNGNKVNETEIDRELELLKQCGFGGVEINPIAMHPDAPDNGDKALVWMSDEWIDVFVHACKKSKDLGMITDMIVGTGWPFGGEFLQLDETCQRVVTHFLPFEGGTTIQLDEDYLQKQFIEAYKGNRIRKHQSENTTFELFHLTLVPEKCSGNAEVIDLKDLVDKNGQLRYHIDQPGKFNLCYGFLERNFRRVSLGAPGGAGPVMNHYRKDVTYAYLSRLMRIAEKTGIPLHELVRALFCDSIEVSGANWTDNFAQLFFEAYGYKLEAWMPFIFYPPNDGYAGETYDAAFDTKFKSQLKRVRYDYNSLLVNTFLGNFTQVFKDFCAENNLLCRYQAYGTPFLMGMLEGYMIPDIPESNNWLYSANMKAPMWQWSQGHGYMTWNMFTAAGGHLTGKKIISCESMTNVKGVFRTTLEEIKQHDDMNFITGMNHSVLHGFNYSPRDVAFPGWIRFGTFFSELNPWWKHLNHWVKYNARLSYLFQNSQADKSIAIVGPISDLWGDVGLTRGSFHVEPSYLYQLWEPISQLGYSCEYINEKIIQGATFSKGEMQYGNMKYDLLVLASLKSMDTKTALAIERFVKSGGRVMVVEHLPIQSLHLNDYKTNDDRVKHIMEHLLVNYPQSFIPIEAPKPEASLLSWTQEMLTKSTLKADVKMDKSFEYVYQIHQYTAHKEIFFFTNVHRFESAEFVASFPVEGKYPWVWNPETGEKTPYAYNSNPSELNIELKPLQSLVLVFESEKPANKAKAVRTKTKELLVLNTTWDVEGKRVDGKRFNWKMDKLIDFSQSDDVIQSTFGGDIIYKTSFDNAKGITHIDLGNVNEGVTELFVNGSKAGTRWYGQAIYPISEFLKEGNNDIEIHYTTVLTNYCTSLKDNKVAQNWTKHKAIAPTGIEGPVRLLVSE